MHFVTDTTGNPSIQLITEKHKYYLHAVLTIRKKCLGKERGSRLACTSTSETEIAYRCGTADEAREKPISGWFNETVCLGESFWSNFWHSCYTDMYDFQKDVSQLYKRIEYLAEFDSFWIMMVQKL